jgi:hypothetical protein
MLEKLHVFELILDDHWGFWPLFVSLGPLKMKDIMNDYSSVLQTEKSNLKSMLYHFQA